MGHENHHHITKSKHHHDHHIRMVGEFKKRFWVSLLLTLPVLALSPTVQSLLNITLRFPGDIYALWVLSSVVFLYGGWPFLKGAFREISNKNPGMMTLIGIAIIVAYIYSTAVVFGLEGKVFFWELVTLIDVMLLGHWIEMRSVIGASRALEKLAQLLPSEATRIKPDGSTEQVDIKDIKPGDLLLVKPGERIPADGTVIDGKSYVDESMLTGESIPILKVGGDEVIGGSINGEGSLIIEVRKTGEDSYLHQVISLVQEAQESKSRTQDLANRAARWLTFIAITVGVITFTFWLFSGKDLAFALERMVTVMVIACPHALGLAIPLVVAVSTSLAASRGLLIRNREAFERARNLQAVIFDKTGTLTEGRFSVVDVVVIKEGMGKDELLRMVAAVESRSEHPIARAITESVPDDLPDVRDSSFAES